MTPILFNSTERTFSSNGIGRLADCTRCEVTEERNGIYECEFDYPVTGVHFEDIQIGRIIACTHDEEGDLQPFDIVSKSEPIDGLVTFYARHVGYRACEITVKPFEATSCAEAFVKIAANSIGSTVFSYWTNKSVSSDMSVTEPRQLRGLLMGEEGSVLDVYGTGEYEFDNFNIKLHLHRGQDTNVSIRYGKNLVEFENEVNAEDVYTAAVPFWAGDVSEEEDETSIAVPTLITLPEWFIRSGNSAPSGREIFVPMDLSDAFEDVPTVDQLRERAASRLASSDAWKPAQTMKVDFVQLWQTEEYANYAPLQRLKLCDTCGVFVPMYNTAVRAKVIKTVWNVLLDRYDEMELGDKPTTYAAVLEKQYDSKVQKMEAGFQSLGVSIQNAQANAESNAKSYTDSQISSAKTTIESEYEQAIEDATELLRGGTGGYVITSLNAAGQPIELLITDNINPAQAVNVWRWNLGGLAHSSNGYNGPFNDVAITQDGKINASMITTGTLLANLIRAGIISDVNGRNNWNLDTGVFTTTNGTIGGFTIGQDDIRYGDPGASAASGLVLDHSSLLFASTDGTERKKTLLHGSGLAFWKSDGTTWTDAGSIGTVSTSGNTSLLFINGDARVHMKDDGTFSFYGKTISENLTLGSLQDGGTGYFSNAHKYAFYIFICRAGTGSYYVPLTIPAQLLTARTWAVTRGTSEYHFSVTEGTSRYTMTGYGTGAVTNVYGIGAYL